MVESWKLCSEWNYIKLLLKFFFTPIATSKDLPLQTSNKRSSESKSFVFILWHLFKKSGITGNLVLDACVRVQYMRPVCTFPQRRQEILMIIFSAGRCNIYLFYQWFPVQNWTGVLLLSFIRYLHICVGKRLGCAVRCTNRQADRTIEFLLLSVWYISVFSR